MNYDKEIANLVKKIRTAESNLQYAYFDGDINSASKFFSIIMYLNESYEDLTGLPFYSHDMIVRWSEAINELEELEDNGQD